MFAESLARNAPECKVAHAPTATSVAWQGRINSAKYATAPTPKALNSVSNAKSSHVKPPSKDPSVTVTASTFQAKPKIVSFKFSIANLLVITYGVSRNFH